MLMLLQLIWYFIRKTKVKTTGSVMIGLLLHGSRLWGILKLSGGLSPFQGESVVLDCRLDMDLWTEVHLGIRVSRMLTRFVEENYTSSFRLSDVPFLDEYMWRN